MSDAGMAAAVGGAKIDDPIRVMVVDDALVIRGMLSRMLEAESDIDVVASAGDGERALAALQRSKVDVVVLDIEMPRMDGIEALPKIIEANPGVQVVMASTLTKRNAEISLRAMELGASDYLTKPGSSGELRSAEEFQRDLVAKVRSLGRAARMRRGIGSRIASAQKVAGSTPLPTTKPGARFSLRPLKPFRPNAIAIGSSTGGPQALMKMLAALGPINQPIFITQHMPPTFTTILAENISRAIKRDCVEAQEGMTVKAETIYLAPGDRHMVINATGGLPTISLSDGPKENFCRPAVNPMLRSLSATYREKLLIAILTGMGSDGAEGAKVCVNAGAQVLAQDEESSVVWGMPGAAAQAGICGAVLPLNQIGPEIRRFAVEGGRS